MEVAGMVGGLQVAFPVVGVLLCAVLVFAFGFKSSVAPPSFASLADDTDEESSRGKGKKVKPKKVCGDDSNLLL